MAAIPISAVTTTTAETPSEACSTTSTIRQSS
jgi:hypothetical protein